MVVFCDFETRERGNFDLETWEYVLLLVGSWNAWFYVLNFLKISNYFWIMQIPNPKRPVCIDLPQLMTLNFLPALQIAYLPSTLIFVLLDNVLVIWTHVCHSRYTSIEGKNASMETGLLNGIRSPPIKFSNSLHFSQFILSLEIPNGWHFLRPYNSFQQKQARSSTTEELYT